MPEIKTVTIPEETFESLLKSHKILRALEIAGVDNWEGYGEAIGNCETTTLA